MIRRIAVIVLALAVLALAGCSDDEGGDEGGGGNGGSGGNGDGQSAGLPDDCVTRLRIVGASDQGVADGPFGAQLVISEGGSTEGGTPDEAQTLSLAAFGNYVPEASSIPSGDPGAPDEGHVLVVTLEAKAAIDGDEAFSTEGGDDGTATLSLWSGSTEVEVGDATVTITGTSGSRVCGSIEPASGGAGVSGTFKAQRLEGSEF
jgi:hypothetical protein